MYMFTFSKIQVWANLFHFPPFSPATSLERPPQFAYVQPNHWDAPTQFFCEIVETLRKEPCYICIFVVMCLRKMYIYIYTYIFCTLRVFYLSSHIPTKMNSSNPPTISGQTFCHLSAEAKRVTAVKCNVPNCPMPIVPPAAISPHDTWWKKALKSFVWPPPNLSSSLGSLKGSGVLITTCVMVFVVGRGDKPTSWNHMGPSTYWLFV